MLGRVTCSQFRLNEGAAAVEALEDSKGQRTKTQEADQLSMARGHALAGLLTGGLCCRPIFRPCFCGTNARQ